MALQIAINTIVFTDKMWVEFNSTRRKQDNVSRVIGKINSSGQFMIAMMKTQYG